MIAFYTCSLGVRCGGRITRYHRRLHLQSSQSHNFMIQLCGAQPNVMNHRRTFTSSSLPSNKEPVNNERKWTLLYHRSPSRTTYPRVMLGTSSFNLTYWMWYCLDFTPSVNASAQSKYELGQIDLETLELLLIDESLGAVGFGLASMIWLGAFLYTKQLVSAIWASKNSFGSICAQAAISDTANNTWKDRI